MKPVQIGVIGSGYWGPNLIRNFVELEDADVACVADLDPARLAAVRKRYPSIATTTDYRDFFGMGLEAVVVSTPPPTHYALARDCLEHGLHVLVEKPLTLNSEHAQALVDLAAERDLRLMVGHTFEYNAAVQAIKRTIESGELGDIHYVDAVRVNLGLFQEHLDVLWDLAPHDLSILRYILGSDPVEVSACGTACIYPGIFDLVYAYLVFPNNTVAHLHVSWLDPCKVRRLTIVGSKKMLVYDDVEPLEKIRIYDKGVDKPAYTDTFAEFQCSYRHGDVTIPHLKFPEPLRVECQHFVDSIRNGTEPCSSGADGLAVVRALELAEQSLRLHSTPQHAFTQEPIYGYHAADD